jgi:hypothetical protein
MRPRNHSLLKIVEIIYKKFDWKIDPPEEYEDYFIEDPRGFAIIEITDLGAKSKNVVGVSPINVIDPTISPDLSIIQNTHTNIESNVEQPIEIHRW